MLVGFILIFVLSLFAVCLYYKRQRLTTGKDIPRPRGFPIIGNINLLLGNLAPCIVLQRVGRELGDVFKLSIGFKDVVVLNSAEVIREAFGKKGDDFSGRPYVYSIDRISHGDGGIAFRDFSPSLVQHKKVSAAALRSNFVGYFEESTGKCIFRELDELLSSFQKECNAFDPSDILNVAIANIILNITCSIKYEAGDIELEELLQANDNLKVIFKVGDIIDVFPCLKVFPNKRQRLVVQLINIRDKVFVREYERHKCSHDPDNTRDFVDALLNLGYLPKDQIVMTAWEMFSGGFESTFQTMRWAILYLMMNQEVQSKIQRELDENSWHRYPAWKNRRHLPYLEATVLEVLRHSSFSSLNGPHQTTIDTEISGYKIPKGTMVLSNLWWVHHDPSTWTSPGEFNPDRFIDTKGSVHVPPQFLPFSIGRRKCLGDQFAKMEVFTLLGGILQRYTILPSAGDPIPSAEPSEPDMIRVADPFRIQVLPRAKQIS
ncbi:steroid 17-alpha-hydroxylase/17,20 lyase-like [Anneissia japonica]|uniref:steroid 17-alpha-hydroxylase/17,20 lyase-like n=1 Tax=Anneissia japonica TaxID=1529436 RepID=UPI001425B5EE|nr:steroid 17-alpha-hydroxylase/17,20 lyase-like [Anneissia japonica]